MRKILALLLISFLLLGCTGSAGGSIDAVSAAKTSGQIQSFLQAHPNAKIVVLLLDGNGLAKAFQQTPECAAIGVSSAYQVTFSESGTTAVAFVSPDTGQVLCAVVNSAGGSASATSSVSAGNPSATSGPSQETSAQVGDERLVEYRNDAQGYKLLKPASWSADVEEDSYLIVAKDDNTDALIWPIQLSGQYKSMTGVDLGNYIIGLVKKQYDSFTPISISTAPDGSSMEVVATITFDNVPLKGVLTTFVDQNGHGLLAGYEAPVDQFDKMEPVLRKIISSYQLVATAQTQAAVGPQPAQTGNGGTAAGVGGSITLVPYQASDGSYSMQVPQGWQVDTLGSCSTRSMIAYDPQNPVRRIFAIGSNNYVIPVQQGTAEEVAVNGLPVVQQYDAAFTAPTNIQLGAKEPYPATQGAPGIVDAGEFEATMTIDGKPVKGRLGTYVLGGYGVYELSLSGTVAGADEFESFRSVMDQSIKSFAISQAYANQCSASSQADSSRRSGDISKTLSETSDIITSGYDERSKVQDRVAQKWSDTTLGVDRVYNPDSDQVYQVPNDFYGNYDINRQKFEQQNLQPLTPNQWNDYAPLDGNLNIR